MAQISRVVSSARDQQEDSEEGETQKSSVYGGEGGRINIA